MNRSSEVRPASPVLVLAMLLAPLAVSGQEPTRPGPTPDPNEVLQLDDLRAVASMPAHAVSPDGRRVAYLLQRDPDTPTRLVVTPARGGAAEMVAGTQGMRALAGWSSSGARIAFLASRSDGQEGAALWTVAPGDPPSEACTVPGSARSPAWVGNDTLAFSARLSSEAGPGSAGRSPARVSSDPPAGEAVFVCGVSSGRVDRVTAGAHHGLEFAWSPEGRDLVVSAQREPGFYGALETDLYRIDLATGAAHPLVDRPGVDRSPLWSPDGRRIAFVTGFGRSGLVPNLGVASLDVGSGRVDDIGRGHDRGGFFEGPFLAGWEADSRAVYYGVIDGVRLPLFRMPLEGGPPERLSTPWEEAGSTYAYQLSVNGETVVFRRSTTDRPPELFAAATGGGPVVALTNENRSLAPLGVPRARVVRWTAGDGSAVEGLLLVPLEGRGGPPYPLVTVLHGGPSSAYTLGYPGLAFFNPYQDMLLAARGYAVFLPNPRGSGGYGEAFRRAAVGDWGRGPTDDVLAGLDQLVEEGIADPDRLALAGWSYGGYLAAWILAETDRFRAASVGAGVVDLEAHHGQAADQMHEYFGGRPWERADLYRDQSPITHVHRVSTPTLVFHGAADVSVSPSQSEQLHAALESLDVPSTLVMYPGEAHSLRQPDAQDDGWERFLDWLERWGVR